MIDWGNDQQLLQVVRRAAYHLRYWSLVTTTAAGSGHPTSCLSAADLVATLFFGILQSNPTTAHFILSKGHAAPLLYAAWHELGIISKAELLSLRSFNSPLEGHPTPRFPLAEAATGSLGQGLSIGIGYTLAEQILKKTDKKTYVLLGDGECAEGSVWEAAELASFYHLHNLIGIIDVNRLGQSDQTLGGWDSKRIAAKWHAFGWETFIINGHNVEEIYNAYRDAQAVTDKPSMIIARTIKGYGVEQCADKEGFHGKVFSYHELPKVLENLAGYFSKDTYDI